MSLVEVMIALVLCSVLIGALYQVFIGQQRIYNIQEQVADAQQNVRVVSTKMMRELRMAGFGNVWMVLPVSFEGKRGGRTTFNHVVNPDTPSRGWITVVTAINSLGHTATLKRIVSPYQIIVDRLTDDGGHLMFDTANRKYISIGGLESHRIMKIDERRKEITLDPNGRLIYDYPPDATRIFPIRAISYLIGRDENLGGGQQPLGENVEKVEYEYKDEHANQIADPSANPEKIRMIKVTVTARTRLPDPKPKGIDAYRRREISSNIHIRNSTMGTPR